ncbi:NHL repeat-containing protein [Spirosoma areae]
MSRLLVASCVAVWFIASVACAHPGVGIVRDSRGTIFYTDLVHVWKIIPGSGRRQLAVRNVHTHELALDTQDNLFGEHLWYEGEATNKWGHYVWRLSSSGQLTKVIPTTEGFLTNYSFVRDRAGAMYWVERGVPTRFMKKSPKGRMTLLATGTFRDVRWQHVTPDGVVYFVNDDGLHRLLPNGTIKLINSDLDEAPASASVVNHNLMGLWSDPPGNVYVAVSNQRKVQCISPNGRVTTVVRVPSPWAPSGGLLAPDGSMWLLEFSPTNQVRVRRIDKQGRVQVF